MPHLDPSTELADPLAQDILCVGLTGGIGCGKSTVVDLFAEHGAGIIDTDLIAHHLTQNSGEAIDPIREIFGDDCISDEGALDRKKMRGLIFSDTSAKQQLESILHPLIFEQAKAQLQQLQDKPYIIIVVPLLPENPAFRQLVQRVLVVDCAEDKQVERVVKRSGMSVAEVRTIIAQQTPRATRLLMANDVIHNDTDTGNLDRQVAALHEFYANA
jgi:dephospho-CoA kinase